MAAHSRQAVFFCYLVCFTLRVIIGAFPIDRPLRRLVETAKWCNATVIVAIRSRLEVQTAHWVVLDDLLLEHLDVVLESLECNEDNREVVK